MYITLKTLFYFFKVVTFLGQHISRRHLPLRRAVVTVRTVCNNARSIKGTSTFFLTSPQRIKTQTVRSVELEHKEQPPFYLSTQQRVSRMWCNVVSRMFEWARSSAVQSVDIGRVRRAERHRVVPDFFIRTISQVDLLFEIPVLLCLAVLDCNHNTITNRTSCLNY